MRIDWTCYDSKPDFRAEIFLLAAVTFAQQCDEASSAVVPGRACELFLNFQWAFHTCCGSSLSIKGVFLVCILLLTHFSVSISGLLSKTSHLGCPFISSPLSRAADKSLSLFYHAAYRRLCRDVVRANTAKKMNLVCRSRCCRYAWISNSPRK